MAVRAYPVTSEEKFPGALAGRILSDGISSRLMKYVRAEKGYTYGVRGLFEPGRHGGSFLTTVATQLETTRPCIEAIFKVLNDMRHDNVMPTEMSEAKMRTTGAMVMAMQTIDQQAAQRIDGILNDYPIDYYDVYPQRIAKVDADQVREVMNKYVNDDAMLIVVVAPASQVKSQLEQLGDVQVMPMPLKRQPTSEPSAK